MTGNHNSDVEVIIFFFAALPIHYQYRKPLGDSFSYHQQQCNYLAEAAVSLVRVVRDGGEHLAEAPLLQGVRVAQRDRHAIDLYSI